MGEVGMMGTSQKAFGLLYMTAKDALDLVAKRSGQLRPFKFE